MTMLRNPRHERFAQERAMGKSQREAWQIANGSLNKSGAYSSRLAAQPHVAARIRELRAEYEAAEKQALETVVARFEVTTGRVLAELAKIAFANIADYVDLDRKGEPNPDLSALSRDQLAAVRDVTVEERKTGSGENASVVRKVRFRLFDKRAALVALGHYLGLFGERPPRAVAHPPLLEAERMPTAEEWEAELNAGAFDS
jgi:phage terminase small subunit